jgi:MFS family permease
MTKNQKILSRKYLVYKIFSNLWFLSAVWLYFYRLFITDQQIGFLDGMAFAIGLLAEVPSGALADRFGRAKMVKIGQVVAASGFLIQAFGSSFSPFFVGQSILVIGVALVSGADDALFFDKLNFKRKSLEWRKLVMRASQMTLIASLVATVFGGWMHTINPRIPWILSGLALIISILPIWSIKEEKLKKNTQGLLAELKEYLIGIKAGFKQFGQPKLLLYVPIIITVQGLFYTFGWGVLQIILLDRFHFSSFWGSVVVAVSSLTTFTVLTIMHKYSENMSEKHVIGLISFGAVIGLLLSLVDIGAWGFVVILFLYAGENILHPFMSEILNNQAPEKQRATVLSVAAFLQMLPYVVLAPIIGYLNMNNKLGYFLIVWSFLIGLAILFYFLFKKKDARIKLEV